MNIAVNIGAAATGRQLQALAVTRRSPPPGLSVPATGDNRPAARPAASLRAILALAAGRAVLNGRQKWRAVAQQHRSAATLAAF